MTYPPITGVILAAITALLSTSLRAIQLTEAHPEDANADISAVTDADTIPPATETPTATKPATNAATAFIHSPILRDPFWPVDYDPNPPAPKPVVTDPVVKAKPELPKLPEPGAADWDAAAKKLTPTVGHSVDPAGEKLFFAFLNNRLLTIGQTVPLKTPLFIFTWRVTSITAAGVEFTPVEAKRLSDNTQFAPPTHTP